MVAAYRWHEPTVAEPSHRHHGVDVYPCVGGTHGDTTRRTIARDPAGPRQAAGRADHVRREGSGHEIPSHRAAAAAAGGTQRAHRPPGRCGVWRLERVRRAMPDAELRA